MNVFQPQLAELRPSSQVREKLKFNEFVRIVTLELVHAATNAISGRPPSMAKMEPEKFLL